MDDGWFHGRNDDHAGLGDWWPDARKFPNGLTPLIRHVNDLAMDFGLWIEPEMVNPDSDLYRSHPDWVIHFPNRARTEGRVAEPLYDGIRDLLSELHAGGWQLGVVTGKSDRGLTGCLMSHAILDLFVTLQTADRHPSKPHPSMLETAMAEAGALPADTAMIGDTAYDIEMARAAGCRAIGVAWGYHAPEELLAAGAEGVARTAAELREMLDG